MKTLLLFLLILLQYYVMLAQQTPQFPLVTSASTIPGTGPFDQIHCVRIQSVYKPSEFPGAPAGMITHLYLKSGSNKTTNCTFRNMTIKMAKMPTEGGNNVDTLYHTLPINWYSTTGVYYSSNHTISAPLDSNDWIQFTLQQPFYYDGINNLLVEMSHDSAHTASPAGLIKTMQFVGSMRTYQMGCAPYYTSNWLPISGTTGQVNIIGFDIQPNSVDNVQNISNLSIFPNPSQGIFSINFETKKKVEDVQITITSITGNIILHENHKKIDKEFRRQIDLSNNPTGVYFVVLKADSERIMKKVVVQ